MYSSDRILIGRHLIVNEDTYGNAACFQALTYSLVVMQMIHNLFIVAAKNRHDARLCSSEASQQKQQTTPNR